MHFEREREKKGGEDRSWKKGKKRYKLYLHRNGLIADRERKKGKKGREKGKLGFLLLFLTEHSALYTVVTDTESGKGKERGKERKGQKPPSHRLPRVPQRTQSSADLTSEGREKKGGEKKEGGVI